MTPGSGLRFQTAIRTAPIGKSATGRSPMDQPMTRLEKASTTTARYSQPSSDRKSTRLNSSHVRISYAVFCLKKKKKKKKKNKKANKKIIKKTKIKKNKTTMIVKVVL